MHRRCSSSIQIQKFDKHRKTRSTFVTLCSELPLRYVLPCFNFLPLCIPSETPNWKKKHRSYLWMSEKLASLGIMNTIVLWCTGDFKVALNWAFMMPKDASLSNSYASAHCFFSSLTASGGVIHETYARREVNFWFLFNNRNSIVFTVFHICLHIEKKGNLSRRIR